MLCTKPFVGRARRWVNGKQQLFEIPVPCGQCFHCRVNQARIWQTRLMLEVTTSFDSAFLTLTFDDIHLPSDGSVCKETLQKFLKRYRKRFEPHKIRYFAIGEYGHDGKREWNPHYHIALFSPVRIERCYLPCQDMRKRDLCTHDCYLGLAWPYGNVEVSRTLGRENAGYITGYIKKKATKAYREGLGSRQPEFMTSSRGRRNDGQGGIGYRAIEQIAKKFGNNKEACNRVIRSIKFGTTPRALGGYLTNCLSNQLGISGAVRQDEFVNYATECERIFSNSELRSQKWKEDSAKRNSIEVKYHHFKRKRRKL